jgi:hypothetical protein
MLPRQAMSAFVPVALAWLGVLESVQALAAPLGLAREQRGEREVRDPAIPQECAHAALRVPEIRNSHGLGVPSAPRRARMHLDPVRERHDEQLGAVGSHLVAKPLDQRLCNPPGLVPDTGGSLEVDGVRESELSVLIERVAPLGLRAIAQQVHGAVAELVEQLDDARVLRHGDADPPAQGLTPAVRGALEERVVQRQAAVSEYVVGAHRVRVEAGVVLAHVVAAEEGQHYEVGRVRACAHLEGAQLLSGAIARHPEVDRLDTALGGKVLTTSERAGRHAEVRVVQRDLPRQRVGIA